MKSADHDADHVNFTAGKKETQDIFILNKYLVVVVVSFTEYCIKLAVHILRVSRSFFVYSEAIVSKLEESV